MDQLPRIPTPPALRWREFRLRFVPLIVFVVALGVVITMWQGYVIPASLVGQVEMVRIEVKSPRPGALTRLKVTRFQEVTKDEIVGEVMTTDPKLIQAALEVSRATVASLRAGLDPVLNLERNKINFQQLELTLLSHEIELARSKVNLHYAHEELERAAQLRKDGLLPDSEYDLVLKRKNVLEQDVDGTDKLLARMKEEKKKILPAASGESSTDDALQAQIELEQKKLQLLEAQMSAVILTAPLDGTVSMIHRQVGENIQAGEPILTISARHSDKIVGYLRPPLAFPPRPGMLATVTTRGFRREEATTPLLEVGSEFEPITNALQRTPNVSFEVGLQVIFARPPQMKTLPGELLDINIRRSK